MDKLISKGKYRIGETLAERCAEGSGIAVDHPLKPATLRDGNRPSLTDGASAIYPTMIAAGTEGVQRIWGRCGVENR